MSLGDTLCTRLPPAFLWGIILFNAWAFNTICCFPALTAGMAKAPSVEHGKPAGHANPTQSADFTKAYWECIGFNGLAFMLVVSYLSVCFTSPGRIPDDGTWSFTASSEVRSDAHVCETKDNGDRRNCKWCARYKPDRSHHCRVCDCCTLRMDHHCPWVNNCIGNGNYKFFMQLLIYTCVTTIFQSTCMMQIYMTKPRSWSGANSTQFGCFLTSLSMTSAIAVVMTLFMSFHFWLISQGMTTIEFCEKQRDEGAKHIWDKGMCQNFKDVFGSNPFFWMLPVKTLTTSGLVFNSQETSKLVVNLNQHRRTKSIAALGSKPHLAAQKKQHVSSIHSRSTDDSLNGAEEQPDRVQASPVRYKTVPTAVNENYQQQNSQTPQYVYATTGEGRINH